MPIEVLQGKTGPRLIARAPLTIGDGSRATITYETSRGVQRFWATYQGCSSGGYPVLSPDLLTLERHIATQIEGEQSALVHNATVELDNDDTRRVAEKYRSIRPLLTSIKVGTVLRIVLPQPFPTTRYTLGEVVGWEIFNT